MVSLARRPSDGFTNRTVALEAEATLPTRCAGSLVTCAPTSLTCWAAWTIRPTTTTQMRLLSLKTLASYDPDGVCGRLPDVVPLACPVAGAFQWLEQRFQPHGG